MSWYSVAYLNNMDENVTINGITVLGRRSVPEPIPENKQRWYRGSDTLTLDSRYCYQDCVVSLMAIKPKAWVGRLHLRGTRRAVQFGKPRSLKTVRSHAERVATQLTWLNLVDYPYFTPIDGIVLHDIMTCCTTPETATIPDGGELFQFSVTQSEQECALRRLWSWGIIQNSQNMMYYYDADRCTRKELAQWIIRYTR